MLKFTNLLALNLNYSPKHNKSKPIVTTKNFRKRSSPHKGTPSKRFKSQEFVNTEDDSSSAGEQAKEKDLKHTKIFKKAKKQTKESRYPVQLQ